MLNSDSIPQHWKIVRLGDFVKTEKGKKPKVVSNTKTKKCSIPYINIKAFEKNIIDEFTDGVGCVICEDDDFLMVWDGSRSGYVGKAIKGALGSTLVRIKLPEVDHNYAYYFLQSKFIEINTKAKGVGIPHVDPGLVWNYILPLPPIIEQHQIVSKIEELFSELDKGKQQLETVKQQLKTYRQSLLNTIIRNVNIQLIGSIIEKFDQGWSPKCLNESSTDEDEWAVIKTTAVQHGSFVSIQNKILPKELKPRIQHELKTGDILITRAGPRIRVGVCCMVKKTRPKLINCDKVYRIRVKERIVMPEYLELVLNTPYYQHEIEKMKTGISDSGVNLTQSQFLKISISIPHLEEQQKIVTEIESRLSVCDKIEEIIETSLKQSESLRQSILKQAFEGKLVNANI